MDREQRREIAERDAAILARAGPDPEFDQVAAFADATPMPDLD